MNKSKADSYLQKLKERRLDPIGDPLICGIRVPYPFSSGFSTGEVLEKALAWHQEFAARVRKYQEEPDMPLQERTEAANLLVNLATEATMTVKALSITFPDVFKAVASRKASFPINIPALPEDRDEIIHWLTETLQLGSEHELKLRGRKTFSRRTFANKLLLYCISRIKMRAIELLQFRIDNLFQLEGVELLLEWKNPHDLGAKVGRTKDAACDMIYKPEHVNDLESGAIVQAEVLEGDHADTKELSERVASA
ncbi:MAG: hypothetical protein WA376_05075, partial [Terrimicrobiaceae bacterium]